MGKSKWIMGLVMFVVIQGCTAKQDNLAEEHDSKMSIAAVQREIRVGMPNAEVVEILGSPNMVTTDAQRREVWVYDKVSTLKASSSTQGGLWLILASAGGESSTSSTSQKTLTIIIKFDKDNLVRDYSYRQSSF